MNYRHAFHAGNFADVVKHAALAFLIDRLKQKDSPFCVIDTHAGIGRYDLSSIEAQKTGEFRYGIERVLAAAAQQIPDDLKAYLDIVRAMNVGGPLRWYPGSPRLALDLLRPQDRLALVELHPEDAQTLQGLFAGDRRVKVHHADGYIALKAFLPPKERRGLVLIDPPFEKKDEFERLTRALKQAHRRWATGQYLLWHPIKARRPIDGFHDLLREAAIPRVLIAEFMLRRPRDPDLLNGCGLVLVNPPWKSDEALGALLPKLAKLMPVERDGGARVEWLTPEEAPAKLDASDRADA